MSQSAKRIYTELNAIKTYNYQNPNSKKFLIDTTPFNDDDSSEAPKTEKDAHDEYYIVIGRILPTSNIFNRSAFKIKIKIPTSYPFKGPIFEMLTPIYHPNIGPEGKICIAMLRSKGIWKPVNTLSDAVDAVLDYIDKPNIDEAECSETANEYMKNRAEFERKAAEKIASNMVPRQ